FMATAAGTVKKTPLKDFSRPRASGIIAVELMDGDRLVGVQITDGEREILLFSSGGKVIRFRESEVRAMGRVSRGVRGIRLGAEQEVIALIIADDGAVLTASENGYGKRTALDEFPRYGRGGQGVIAMQASERNGPLVGAVLVGEEDEIMLITNGGTLVRTRTAEVPVLGRNTQGVKLISLGGEERLVGMACVAENGEEDEEDSEADAE
ncbi:MAG TPA: DNA gyrase C-terminal beta-propeller domain-containing protein, partial [Gammaproteobacteria bacterium]|nr:DNA gyrase C-terminal beta-propeller domain-containing protein [Gammaproteobacteria bacterium]